MILPLYNAAAIEASWAGIDFTKGGLGTDVFLEVTQIGALKEVQFGAAGEMGVSKLANRGGTISITLQQSAPLNKELARMAYAEIIDPALMVVAPFIVKDKVGSSSNFIAINAVMTAMPDQSYGVTMGEQTWIWTCEAFIPTDDPITATAAIASYLK